MKHKISALSGKRLLSVFLTVVLCLGLIPSTALAVQTGSSDANRTVFDALGFDTSAPEGYQQEEGITDTPFGKTYTTLAEIDELSVFSMVDHDTYNGNKNMTLFGQSTDASGNISGFFNDKKTQTASVSYTPVAMTVEGNFSTANNGQKKNVALFTLDLGKNDAGDATGSLTLRTATADGSKSSDPFRFASSYSTGGNQLKLYQLYNWYQLAVGDFDGDGIDEIAVAYTRNGENYKNSPNLGTWPMRISVYKLQSTSGDSYLDINNWKLQWEKTIPLVDYSYTCGWMMSMTAADVNKDGVDDLAFAYSNFQGYYDTYYKPAGGSFEKCGEAFVAFGGDSNKMFSNIADVPVDDLYRTGVAVGDVDSDGLNELVVGGSETNDGSDRALQIFKWNGSGFDMLARTSVDPKNLDKYYNSSPRVAANVATGSFFGIGDSSGIYLDSIFFTYDSDGLVAQSSVRWEDEGLGGPSDWELYYEWNARAADFTGSGQELICLNYAYVLGATYLIMGPDMDWGLKQKCVFASVSDSGVSRVWEDSSMREINTGDHSILGWQESRAIPYCLPNTDNDTVVLRYTGEHYYTYADPEVLAVLASPPYFADLANDDDDSQMIESKTSYGASHGSGGGSTYSNSFSIGVYTSWEKTWSMLGVELASAEAEVAINNTFTWETQNTSTIEYQVEYATMAGVDTVVLYALPVETYVYEATMADGTTQTMTVNIPYQPSVRTISAEEYSTIQKVYSDILPDVSQVLTHTVGDPGSYAGNVGQLSGDRWQTLVFDGDFATIGQGSQNTIAQTIEMTSEKENSFNYELAVETKAGFGSGGITVGVTAGYSHGAGSVHITTAGSSYSGEMNGLPTQAQQYGYSFNWKLVGFLWQGKYPVVTYLVNDVVEPPLLPERFGVNEDETTTNQIALEWDYPGNAAGFIIYRYFQSPSSSGYYKIATVGSGDYQSVSNGMKHYQYIDEGLSPNTAYQYRIQTIGVSQPNTSIPSEALSTYTKPEAGAPQVAVSADTLATYPDITVSTTAYVTNSDELKNARIYYQWQKQSSSDLRDWEDLDGEDAATLTFQYPDRGVEGVYRCKVGALADQNLVTTYSPEVNVTFAQRESTITDVTIDEDTQTITAKVNGVGTVTVPSGTVNVVLTNTDGVETIYTAALDKSGKASVTIDPATAIYRVTVSYSGSKVFLPAKYDPDTPLFYAKGVTSGTFYDIRSEYTYGDEMNLTKYTFNEDGTVTSEPLPTTPEYWGITVGPEGMDAQLERLVAGYAALPTSHGAYLYYRVTPGDETTKHKVNIKEFPITVSPLTEDVIVQQGFTHDDWFNTLCQNLKDQLVINGCLEKWAEEDLKQIREALVLSRANSGYVPSPSGGSSPMRPGTYELYITNSSRIDQALRGYYLDTSGMDICTDGSNAISTGYIVGRLIVLGPTYDVSATVAEGQGTWGTVKVAYPENTDTASVGQTLIFQASANQGYTVKQWYMVDANGENKTPIEGSQGQSSLTLTQTTAGTRLIVEFQRKSNTLNVSTLPANAGTVTTEDPYFTNGNEYHAGYDFTFKATANEGWHFSGWEYYEAGQTVVYGAEDTYTVVMPDNSVELIAKFERDPYALTLSDGLAAYVDGERVTDLTAIPGDSVVTVKPAPGFELSDGAVWTVNGVALDPQPEGSEYTFTLTADTSVSVDVTAQEFTVSDIPYFSDVGGSGWWGITGLKDGRVGLAGSVITFTIHEASRGFEFRGWAASYEDAQAGKYISTDTTYSFVLEGNTDIYVCFEKLTTGKTFSTGSNIDWEILDAEGQPVSTNAEVLYPGESLKLTATPKEGDMVKGWTVNGTYTADVSKTKTFAYQNLEDTNEFSVTFQPITYYKVYFADNITATADGETISSGDSVGASSDLKFVYTGEGTVTKWMNNGIAYRSLTKDLVVNGLTGDLNITVETGELAFYSVTDVTDASDQEFYKCYIKGDYVDEDGNFAAGSHVWISARTWDSTKANITGVSCEDLTFTKDDMGIWRAETDAIQKDITFTVQLEKKETPPAPGTTYTITFDANGGTLTGAPSAETDEDGKLSALPGNPTRAGYKFDGWYTAKTGGDKVSISTVYTQNTTLYAHWSEESGGGGSSGGGSSGGGSSSTGGGVGISAYAITIAGARNGDVTASAKTAAKGDTVTLTVDPDQGYTLETLTVTDGSGKKVTLTEKNGKYTFTMPASNVTVKATFAEVVTEPENPFVDVADGAYYFDAVLWAAEEGITGGTDATHFSPNATCTRAQAVTFLWRAAGSPAPKSSVNPFTDVKADSYYYDAVLWAVEQGITKGTTDTTFSPNAKCTRAQIVTFLWRSQESPASDSVNPFTDVAADAYYANAVLWAAENSITGGTTATAFSPNNDCTRAQIVTFLYRCLG